MPAYVLDTSALLASMYEEPGKGRVDEVLFAEPCLICVVNLAEFASKCAGGGMARAEIEAVTRGFDAEVIALDHELALVTGLLRPLTRQVGLSLGDRACLALAKSRQAIALTARTASGPSSIRRWGSPSSASGRNSREACGRMFHVVVVRDRTSPTACRP